MQKKIILVMAIMICLFISRPLHAEENTRSIFKNKKVDVDKISAEQEQALQDKKSVLRGKKTLSDTDKETKETQRLLTSHLQDLSQIHIPADIGKVTEVYEARTEDSRLVVHIQDLHTNAEAQFNSAKILEILIKDYNLGLVCSEGADGAVDTSSVSSFPDAGVREKTAKIFVESGELTGEEYLSIIKYPDLPIWGIENKDIYFKNIDQFNSIMKYNEDAEKFISSIKDALTNLKPKIYSKEILDIDKLEADYEAEKIETTDYLKQLNVYISKFNIPIDKYKNISILNDAVNQETKIDKNKIMQESQGLLSSLQTVLTTNNKELNTLMAQSKLFKEQKASPFSFYSYLRDSANKHLKEGMSGYSNLNDFVEYLTKVNSLDTTGIFSEMEEVVFEIKENLSVTQAQKDLVTALRNIKFIENFFNLKISNKELAYYLSSNKDNLKTNYFKTTLTNLTSITGQTSLTNSIAFNTEIIDTHLKELEDFYATVIERDNAMFRNTTREMKSRDVKVAALITGGFHTEGLTKRLREKGYSYIVVIPYSKTTIDEANYRYLLSGKRRPIEELIKEFDNASTQAENKSETGKDTANPLAR